MTYKQRVLKRYPSGELMGLGTSPSRKILFRVAVGFGMGDTESNSPV
jgi:hypothetical protein